MPRVIITAGALGGLERCRQFLARSSPAAAKRAAEAILGRIRMLGSAPDIGRPVPEQPPLRELVIAFGKSGYVALYRHEPQEDTVYVLAFRHQREAGS